MDFAAKLKDKKVPVSVDFDGKRKVLFLAFGGLRQGIRVFEFNKITSGLDNINKIYLRDPYSQWFHDGLPGVGRDIQSIASFLEQYTMHPSTHKVVAFGNSGGGYAALLFGHILHADEVHAFAPKTYINPVKRFLFNDLPPKAQKLTLLRLFFHGQRKYFDLKKIFKTLLNNTQNFHIYYPSGNKRDSFHASRMKNIPGVRLHPYPHEKHGLIKVFKSNGRLTEIIEQSILLDGNEHLPANKSRYEMPT